MAKLKYEVQYPSKHWREDYDLICSECGAIYEVDDKDSADWIRKYRNYCSECGATFRKTKYEIKEFGHLIKDENENFCFCSNCGADFHNYDFDSLDEIINTTHFCYRCGIHFEEK